MAMRLSALRTNAVSMAFVCVSWTEFTSAFSVSLLIQLSCVFFNYCAGFFPVTSHSMESKKEWVEFIAFILDLSLVTIMNRIEKLKVFLNWVHGWSKCIENNFRIRIANTNRPIGHFLTCLNAIFISQIEIEPVDKSENDTICTSIFSLLHMKIHYIETKAATTVITFIDRFHLIIQMAAEMESRIAMEIIA